MEPEGSLPYSQQPTPYHCPEPDQSSPYRHIPLLEYPLQYYHFIYVWIFQVAFPLPPSFPNKTLSATLLSTIHATCTAHLLVLTTRMPFCEEYRSKEPRYVVFTIPLFNIFPPRPKYPPQHPI
jgi:hypothetical protein